MNNLLNEINAWKYEQLAKGYSLEQLHYCIAIAEWLEFIDSLPKVWQACDIQQDANVAIMHGIKIHII